MLSYLKNLPATRIYAGRPGNWGHDFRLGSSQIYMLLSVFGMDITQFLPETWSMMSENDQNFDERVLADYDLLNTRYIVSPKFNDFPKEAVHDMRKLGSILQGHPDCRITPGLEISTGSLGQGLSVAAGMAIGAKLDEKNIKVYVLLGDGECQEGQVWEAAMAAAHYRLDNLTAIVDYNKIQAQGRIEKMMSLGNLGEKWSSFGWDVREINGHDVKQILETLSWAKESKNGKPKVVIAHTIKGKGVSFVEHKVEWHGIAPKKEELDRALKELDEPSPSQQGLDDKSGGAG